jgi:P4 family phage/plasmid primase-like protien
MDPNLKQLINNNIVDGRVYTHQSMGKMRCNYHFNRTVMEDFFNMYTEALKNKDSELVEIGIAESHKCQNYIPILVDVDLKFKEEDANEIGEFIGDFYSDEQVKKIIKIYQSVILSIVDNLSGENLICVLLEKNPYKVVKGQTSIIKHGFHLHFPNLFMQKIDQRIHLIPRVKEFVKNEGVFDEIMSDSSTVIDDGYLNSPWLLYGSSKGEGYEPYLITKIFDKDCEEIGMEEAFRRYQIFDSQEKLIPIKGKISSYLPRIMSIIPRNRSPVMLKNNILCPKKEKVKEEKKKEFDSIDAERSLEIAKQLLPLISSERADIHNEWMSIGWILYNISEGSDDGFNLWVDFSEKSENPRGNARYIDEWNRMKRSSYSYTLGTLHYFARIDSPQLYAEYKEKLVSERIEDSLNGSHNSIAKMLKIEHGEEFICASISGDVWYQYVNNHWRRIDCGVFLRDKISNELSEKYKKLGDFYFKQLMKATDTEDEGDKAKFMKRLKQVQTIRKNIDTHGWKNSVMGECKYEFYDMDFKQKLDMNPMLIGFKNGVYDLERNEFRKGRPEDFISKNMPIDYLHYSDVDEDVKEIHSFLERTFPDKSIRKYFLDIASDVFEGGNFRKKVYFWVGYGDNGKSVLQKLFEYMLGDYQIKFDTSIVTGKKPSSGSAHAELARSGGGVRWATMDEPDKDEEINSGVFKKLSGDDKYFARDLFEKGKETTEITPMFKLNFICNKLPLIRGGQDKAVWSRVRVIPFESTFIRPGNANINIPETYEEQLLTKIFPMDLDLNKKLPKMAPAFAWVLLKHREIVTSCFEPEKVLIATNNYRVKTDMFRQFIEECIVEDEETSITLQALYEGYKQWYRMSYSGLVQNKPEVENYFENVWGECEKGKKWTGYRLRTTKDDVEYKDIVIIDDEEDEEETENRARILP